MFFKFQNGQYMTRSGLMKQLNISESLVDSSFPLISEVLRRFHSSGPSLEVRIHRHECFSALLIDLHRLLVN